jgi:hypothetical protein
MNTVLGLGLAVMMLSVTTSPTTGSLPLRRGAYVDVNAGCGVAPSSAKMWFGGGYAIQAPHAKCELKSLSRSSPTQFTVSMRCFENGDHAKPFELIDRISIVSRSRYQLTNSIGRFEFRWCRR